jgi:serine/threonine-protein kinase
MIYYCPRSGGDDNVALGRVPAAGGKTETVAHLDTATREAEAWLPEILPDGKTVLISISGGTTAWRIFAIKPDGTRVEILRDALLARYSAGHLLYVDVNSAAVLGAPFDATSLKVMGSAVPLTEAVDLQQAYGIDDRGMIVYVPPPDAGMGRDVVRMTREGLATPVFDTRSSWAQPRFSPDGKRILGRKSLLNCELWIYDIERRSLARVVQGMVNHDAIGAPHGKRIADLQASTGGHMVVQTVEGAREVKPIDTGDVIGHPQGWSTGGNRLVYTAAGHNTQSDIWTVVMDGASKPEVFVNTPFEETNPCITTDGRFIAYQTNETGANEVVVRQVPDTGQSWQVSIGGGRAPMWSRDGRELYFVSGAAVMSARVDTRGGFATTTPEVLFTGGFDTDRPRLDIGPDGKLLTVRTPGGLAGQRQIRVVLNWPAEMERLEGARR